MVHMSFSIKAHGVFLCLVPRSAGALCLTTSSQVSAFLLHQFQGLLSQGNATAGAGQEVPVAAGGEISAETSGVYSASGEILKHLVVTPTMSLVVLGSLLAVVVALAILSTLLLWCAPRGGYGPVPTLPGAGLRSRFAPRRRDDECSELESECAGLASLASLAPPTSVGNTVTCASDAADGADRDDRLQSSLPLAPLCPQLVVPDTSNLRVVLPELACRVKQDLVLNVCSVPMLGARPLFRARIAECAPRPADDGCGVYLETLCGEHHFAFASTSELWTAPSTTSPTLPILRSNGLQFATMRKNHAGDYSVMCGLGTLAVFSGDFSAHEAQVTSGQGQVMAQVRKGVEGGYEVTTSPSIDAGMIILGLLLIDKCETNGKP